MENIAKALSIAGGVLIAILIVVVLVKSFGNIVLFQKVQQTEEEKEQIIKYNEQYTKYLGQFVYGTEIITLVNKSVNNGDISIQVNFMEDYEYQIPVYKNGRKTYKTVKVRSGKNIDLTNYIQENNLYYTDTNENETIIGGLKNKAFKCTQIAYDNLTGRVKSISFEEKKWGDLT